MSGVVDFRTQLEDEIGDVMGVAGNPVYVTGGASAANYALNDLDGTDPLYIGKATLEGAWLVQRYSSAAGTMRYANLSNNAGYVSYASAWAARATLTYGLFQALTGV